MSKYIDAEKLIAEIEKRTAKVKADAEKAFTKRDAAGHLSAVTKSITYARLKKLITSLQQQQPEVDLEKEINRELDTRWKGEYLSTQKFRESARHFYELGLNARKEENK